MTNTARFGKILFLGLFVPCIVLLIYKPTGGEILNIKQKTELSQLEYSQHGNILIKLLKSEASEPDSNRNKENNKTDISNKFICPRIEDIHIIPENCYKPKHKARYTSYLATLFSDIGKWAKKKIKSPKIKSKLKIKTKNF